MEKPSLSDSKKKEKDLGAWKLFVRAGGRCLGVETAGEEKAQARTQWPCLVLRGRPGFSPRCRSLHSVMNGFLLVCGRGPSLKSILTKAQNTHTSRPASVFASENSQTAVHLLQAGAASLSHQRDWLHLKWRLFLFKHGCSSFPF